MRRVLHVSAYDVKGGAALATYRLHTGLAEIGLESRLLVARKDGFDSTVYVPKDSLNFLSVKIGQRLDKVPLRLYPNRKKTDWGVGWFPNRIRHEIARFSPDIVHLHWISGFVPVTTIGKLKYPLVWTLYDMAGFTGGCHYSETCNRYQQSCGKCPLLGSEREADLSRWTWRNKSRSWAGSDLTLVTSSRWLTDCAKSSSLFGNRRIERIPSGADMRRYHPMEKDFCRKVFNLPQDKRLILFAAMAALTNKRKGIDYLIAAVRQLSAQWQGEAELVILGATSTEAGPDFGIPTHYLGYLQDDISMALLYNAADVFVAPSIQDNLPNTVGEALACGTPCVAFNTSGLPDMIDHQHNGYLAQPFEVDDLAAGIQWVLEDDERRARLSEQARRKAEAEFDILKIAGRYRDLYEEILTASAPTPR